jgi:predicted nucleotidyltransferase
MTEIKINDTKIELHEFDFNQSKPLDLSSARKNLTMVNNLLREKQIKVVLMYGTLLGACREGDFIPHDTDIDLALKIEEKNKLISVIPELDNLGFLLVRFEENLVSVMKDEVYIDFYFFKKRYFFFRYNSPGLVLKGKYLNDLIEFQFLNQCFLVPRHWQVLLRELYGKTWKTPIKNDPSMNHNSYIRLRKYLVKHTPFIINFYRKITLYVRNKRNN